MKWINGSMKLKSKIAQMNPEEKSEMQDVIRRKEDAIMQQVAHRAIDR